MHRTLDERMDSKGGRIEERKVRKDRERGERTTEREKLSKIRGIKLYFRSARIKNKYFSLHPDCEVYKDEDKPVDFIDSEFQSWRKQRDKKEFES